MRDSIADIVQEIRDSLQTPERRLTEILVPPFAEGVKILDARVNAGIHRGDIAVRALGGSHPYVRSEGWMLSPTYGCKDYCETQELLDPETGFLLRDLAPINYQVRTWTAGSGAVLSWGGGNAIGRLHTLRAEDACRFGSYTSKRVKSYFIHDGKGNHKILGEDELVLNVPKTGDRILTVSLSGDNFFYIQPMRQLEGEEYVLRGLWHQESGKPAKPWTIGTYHLGQEVAPLNVIIRRQPEI